MLFTILEHDRQATLVEENENGKGSGGGGGASVR